MSFVVGIDYSMSCPAVTVLPLASPMQFEACQIAFKTATQKKVPPQLSNIRASVMEEYAHDTERFHFLGEWVCEFIREKTYGDVHVFIEDYAFGARGRVFEIGENGGMLKYKLWEAGYRFATVPPTVVKKFATGSGAAQKEKMHEAFLQANGVNLQTLLQPKSKKIGSPVGDIVDSYFICAYGQSQVQKELNK